MLKNLVTLLLVAALLTVSALFAYKTIRKNEVVVASVNKEQEKITLPKPEIEAIIQEFIAKNPKLILESLQNFQKEKEDKAAKNTDQYVKDNLVKLETSNNPPIFGNKDADISVLVFFDYSCSYCKKAGYVINKLLKSESDVKFIARPVAVLNNNSNLAGKIFLATYKIAPEKLPAIHNELLATNNLSKKTIQYFAEKYDINYKDLDYAIHTYHMDESLVINQKLVENIGAIAVPTFIINGMVYKGFLSEDNFRKIFAEIRATKKN